MNFLDKLVIPQSAHHMVLLKYLLVLTFILFIPYVSVLFGSLSLSLYFKKKAAKTSDHKYLKFAKELIDLVTFNKVIAFGLGIVPVLSMTFCYSQLLHTSGASAPEYIFIGLLLFIIAILFIYTFKYTFHLKDIFALASLKSDSADEDSKEELNKYTANTVSLNAKSGFYGCLFLIVATYVFNAGIQMTADPSMWGNDTGFLQVLFSLDAIAYYLQFIAGAFALTSVFLFYKNFRPNAEHKVHDEEYSVLVKHTSLTVGLISTILLPVFIIITVFTKPLDTLAYDYFGVTAIVLLLLLMLGNFFYAMIKESHTKYGTALLYLFIVVFGLLAVKDQFAFDTSTKKQYAVLAANYEVYAEKLNEEIGGAAPPAVSGEEIYHNICSACHKFDTKLVGPPYKETLPKYEGHMDQLVAFILNPVKKNPDYPAMPNQGLKPNEAEAVAKYIMETYKK